MTKARARMTANEMALEASRALDRFYDRLPDRTPILLVHPDDCALDYWPTPTTTLWGERVRLDKRVRRGEMATLADPADLEAIHWKASA